MGLVEAKERGEGSLMLLLLRFCWEIGKFGVRLLVDRGKGVEMADGAVLLQRKEGGESVTMEGGTTGG